MHAALTAALAEPLPDRPAQPQAAPQADPRGQVWAVLGALYPRGTLVERRRETRYPYPYLVHLTPVDPHERNIRGETVVVVGKHLSERGLGFYHPRPLAHRRMIATLETAAGRRLGFLIDLTWCRFTRQGWYESGGRFLEAVPLPPEEAG